MGDDNVEPGKALVLLRETRSVFEGTLAFPDSTVLLSDEERIDPGKAVVVTNGADDDDIEGVSVPE